MDSITYAHLKLWLTVRIAWRARTTNKAGEGAVGQCCGAGASSVATEEGPGEVCCIGTINVATGVEEAPTKPPAAPGVPEEEVVDRPCPVEHAVRSRKRRRQLSGQRDEAPSPCMLMF
jgi:hypothetical protein